MCGGVLIWTLLACVSMCIRACVRVRAARVPGCVCKFLYGLWLKLRLFQSDTGTHTEMDWEQIIIIIHVYHLGS